MADGRRKKEKRTGRRAAAAAVIVAVVAVLLAPGIPAVSVPAKSQSAPPEHVWQEPVQVLPMAVVKLPLAAEQTPAAEQEEPVSVEVPESAAVEDGYFADAAFLGDSRTEGFHLYSGLKEGVYFFAVGATVESVFTKDTQKTAQGKIPLLDALAQVECGKVYIMLGVNELGWPRSELFYEQSGKLVDRVREDHPQAEVVLQSILPVSAKQEAKKTYVNNARIAVYNELLRQVAQEKECSYVNVAEAVTGEDGCLRADLTFDGVHLNTAGCKLWLEYLRTHSVS